MTCDNCEHKGDLVYPKSSHRYCKFYRSYRDFTKSESCNHDTSKEVSKKKYVYIIEPLCHGNGGWCGSEVYKEYRSLSQALRTKPRWIPVYSPYSGHVINEPRLSKTTNPNDAKYIFDWEKDKWVMVRG